MKKQARPCLMSNGDLRWDSPSNTSSHLATSSTGPYTQASIVTLETIRQNGYLSNDNLLGIIKETLHWFKTKHPFNTN